MNDPQAQLEDLSRRLDEVSLSDLPTLQRRLEGLRRRLRRGQPIDRGLPRLARDIEHSAAQVARRRMRCTRIEYPPELPVSGARETLLGKLAEHQVVIVCGETGSGKTTQLPKLLLELGYGSRGRIGHTQPRRIAARTVATRLAEELGTPIGEGVGWKVRFSDRLRPESRIKLMTDGILLAEIQSDPELREYDALIIDEAHERSLNIDFLLGYLKRLLPRRPKLKLVITSATIDPERFSHHFGEAPIVRVSGRGHPVEIRYRPLAAADEDSRDRSLLEALVEAVDELAAEGPGDVLVFLPGEREIREAAEALRKHHPPQTEILPLYARLSAAEQQRVFAPHGGRRIVLATNVAETSLTVPGIRFVVDSGLARVSRYSWRAKVQRLHIEPIAQDSADQRAGRCGRLGPGICIRLYSEEDYRNRPRHADPEILRTNLASVILQMAHLGLGDPADFPFIDPPDPRLIRDGWRLLHELGAADRKQRITDIGHRLAAIPLDPRLSRMLLEAERLGALTEVLVIATGLAVQDPRERPQEQRQAADAAHAQWAVPDSDFLTRLRLWQDWQEAERQRSGNQLRKWCRQHFLSWLRMREWQALHRQIRGLLLERGHHENSEPAEPDAIHQALLAGLLDHIGQWDERGYYQGVRQRRFTLHPASVLARRHPKWVMAGLLLDTGRLRALEVARIQPVWIERLAGHLLRRSHGEPRWDERRGQVVARERLTLHGLVIHPGRRVDYGRIDPETAHRLFVLHALVRGEWQTRAECIQHNRALIAEVEDLEARRRRRDLLVDEDRLQRFYAERIPAGIHSGPAFERWYRRLAPEARQALCLSREQLLAREQDPLLRQRFPDSLQLDGLRLSLSYHFAPGAEDDGVTLRLPLALLPRIEPWRADWLVPGLLEEKLVALLRGLPKALRRNFVPAPEFARACAESLAAEGPLLPAFAACLQRLTGHEVPPDAWDESRLEPHLRMRIELLDDEGKVIDSGRDLAALQARWQGRIPEPEAPRLKALDLGGLDHWPEDLSLPEQVEVEQAGHVMDAWPVLADTGSSVEVRLCHSAAEAARTHAAGVEALAGRQLSGTLRDLLRAWPELDRLCLLWADVARCEDLRRMLARALIRRARPEGPLPRDAGAFADWLDRTRRGLPEATAFLQQRLPELLQQRHDLLRRLKGNLPLNRIEAAADVRDQLARLFPPDFLLQADDDRLRQYPRYLRAIEHRLERLDRAPDADRALRVQLLPLWRAFWTAVDRAPERLQDPEWQAFRWQLEELRVALFAQQLGTPKPVSVGRLEKQWRQLSAPT